MTRRRRPYESPDPSKLGAVGDGVTDCTHAFQAAIDEASWRWDHPHRAASTRWRVAVAWHRFRRLARRP